MRTFAIMALCASYASAVAIKGDEVVPEVAAIVDSEIVDAKVDIVSEIVDATADADAAAAVAAAAADQSATDSQIAHNDAQAAIIDAAFDRSAAQENKADTGEDDAVPDNYRPPPKQDIKRREARERPNIHDHALLQSMDLSFVSGGFQNGGDSGRGSSANLLSGGQYGAQQQVAQPVQQQTKIMYN